MTPKKPLFCLVGCFLLTGCGGSAAPAPTGVPSESLVAPAVAEEKLEPSSEASLASLLAQSREELAAQAAALEKTIHDQDVLRLEGHLPFALVPKLRLPSMPPVFREAKYSPERGFSVPPYLEGKQDAALAVHLARHGDTEAALKLADPETAAELKKLALDRNYPVEWTRLVGLMLHHAQVSMASDNIDGARHLLGLQVQLRAILPAATQQSPLGQALLPLGVETLRQAAAAWKERDRTGLAQQADAYLSKFGAAPAWQWSAPEDRLLLEAWLGLESETKRGAKVAAPLRAFDLLSLPAPHAHVDACWTFFDDQGRLAELCFAYRPLLQDYEDAAQWIPRLVPSKQSNVTVTATLTPGNPYVGGVLQLRLGGTKSASLPREIGPLSLDSTFEANRRLVAWKQHGPSVAVKDAKALADLRTPLAAPVVEVGLERERAQDIVSELRVAFPVSNTMSLAAVAAPVWERFGPATVQVGKEVSLLWNDGSTRWALSFPNNREQPIALRVSDATERDAAQRYEAAKLRASADRKARLANNRPLTPLPRSLETLTLGARRADVERFLPGGVNAIRREIPQGLMAVYAGQPSAPADAVVRMIFARFDDAGRLAALRVRYADHPSNKPGTLRKKLEALQAAHGSGEVVSLPASLGADLPARKGPAASMQIWQDDTTLLSCTSDAGSLEITLSNCPPEHADGVPLPPFAFLAPGPDEVSLGSTRSELLAKGAAPFETALLLKSKAGSPFDSILVWFDQERATRIVARYRANAVNEPAKHLQEAWARDVRQVGWPWRQDLAAGQPQSWTTFDARTRYRLF